MSLADDLQHDVASIFRSAWTSRKGSVVPEPEALRLSNDSVELEGTVLYADLAGSTDMVDSETPEFAAEIYKAYLICAAKIIRSMGGSITGYDGDRIMSVFVGDSKNSDAACAALKINWACVKIINPAIRNQYPTQTFALRQVVGIDTSSLYVARTGIRGSNDLVWVGRAANYAAKLSSFDGGHSTQITAAVYDCLRESSKFGDNGQNMWVSRFWPEKGYVSIYGSNWWWSL